ncbi:hypothetical protein LJC32_00120 [Oscillospiraceae bacterium OttesenSCG-928-F05]|nr:hypothetical protein [Oscillospiraceae bacterium OttesenSCG-928-F05]
MRETRRVTLFAGHYGSGKTNLALNYALWLRERHESVALCDLDIVNPYFRTKDSEEELRGAGVRLISSAFANSNLDVPAMPPETQGALDDPGCYTVIDVGGDDRGALALGRYARKIGAKPYEMLLVLNKYRPMTGDRGGVLDILREIEAAGHIRFTGLVNNSNLGAETRAETVLDSLPYVAEIAKETGLPLKMTSVREDLVPELQGKLEGIFPLRLQQKTIWKV